MPFEVQVRNAETAKDLCQIRPTPPERGDSRNSQPSEIADLPQAKVTRMSPCYVRHHLSLNRRLQPAVRQGQFLHKSEEHTSELQSLMRISYAVFCLKKKNTSDISAIQDT